MTRTKAHAIRLLIMMSLATLMVNLVGCAHQASTIEKSAAVESAEQLERKASTAYAKGDAISAAKGFQTASNVYQSLALQNEFANAQLSLARIDSDDGRVVQALARVNDVLQQAHQGAPIAKSTQLLASGRAAALYLQQQNWRAANETLTAAENLCRPTCDALSALLALRAHWSLASGDVASAQVQANSALEHATTPADKANALRGLAQSDLAFSSLALAESHGLQALQLDQALGASARVITDLQLMTRIYTKAGNAPKAMAFQTLSQNAEIARTQLGGK